MEWYAILLVSFSIILLLMGSGLPVFVSFFFANLAGVLLVIGPRGFGMFSNSVYDTLTAENFATVPLFILMGEILFRSGSVEVLSKAVDVVVGKVKGRMYLLVIVLSTIFGALSGSAVAVAAMLGRSLLPQMNQMGYDRQLSSSTILAGASLAPIIPPSVLVVVIGSLVTNVSIAGLLIAGIIPGIDHRIHLCRLCRHPRLYGSKPRAQTRGASASQRRRHCQSIGQHPALWPCDLLGDGPDSAWCGYP
ncbi:MAG: TRAP transporter large permease subunit, partial [Burkholderiaceae bacterium]|nr:TRAP transporter large permease subunit [Burkholderiaceae bacterium]